MHGAPWSATEWRDRMGYTLTMDADSTFTVGTPGEAGVGGERSSGGNAMSGEAGLGLMEFAY